MQRISRLAGLIIPTLIIISLPASELLEDDDCAFHWHTGSGGVGNGAFQQWSWIVV